MNRMKLISLLLICCMVFGFAIPAVAETEEAYDPYVFVWNSPTKHPDTVVEGLPDYYKPYAGRYTYYSPLFCKEHAEGDNHVCCVFNLVNYSELIQDESLAPEGPYASSWAYCADMITSTVHGTTYRRLNLEDGYFSFDEDGNFIGDEAAQKVRAVVRHSFPYISDISVIQDAVNAYLTDTYGRDAVPVEELSGAELVSATQTAIWHFTNGATFESPYPYGERYDATWWDEEGVKDILYPDAVVNLFEEEDEHTASNIRAIYEYLISLDGEESRDVSITDATICPVGTVKDGRRSLTVYFKLDATIDGDDDLVLSVRLGEQTRTFTLGKNNTLIADSDGIYAVTFFNPTVTADTKVEFLLSGTQTVNDVCLYEAKPTEEADARNAAQNFVGCYGGEAPVRCATSYSVTDGMYETGFLSVNKTVVNSSQAQEWESFHFELTVDFSGVSAPDWVTESYQINSVAATKQLIWTKIGDGQYTTQLTLRADETIGITGLPVGSAYTLQEMLAEEDRVKLNVSATILSGNGTVTDALVIGDIAEANSVKYTNTFVTLDSGALEVSKKVVNASDAQEWESFEFRLTLDLSTASVHSFQNEWITDEYLLSLVDTTKELTWNEVDGKYVAEFTLAADETISFDGIAVGTGYVLEEVMSEELLEHFSVSAEITSGEAEVHDATVTGLIAEKNAVIYTNTAIGGAAEGDTPSVPDMPDNPSDVDPDDSVDGEEPDNQKPTEPIPGTGDVSMLWVIMIMLMATFAYIPMKNRA